MREREDEAGYTLHASRERGVSVASQLRGFFCVLHTRSVSDAALLLLLGTGRADLGT